MGMDQVIALNKPNCIAREKNMPMETRPAGNTPKPAISAVSQHQFKLV
jgi:hypothetical protein